MNSNKAAENEDFTIEEHVAISNEEAFEFLFRNEKLQNFVERHNMIFIDGYFVIAAPKYIERSQTGNDAGIHITKWARENLASCSINICKVHRNTRAEAGSEASFSKIQFPSFSINYDNGDNGNGDEDNGDTSDNNTSASTVAKHHPSISSFTAMDWYRLAAGNGKDVADKITSGIIAKNITTMVGNTAATAATAVAAAALLPFIPLMGFGSMACIPAIPAGNVAKKYLDAVYDKALSEIDQRILLLNSDYVAVLNENLEIEEDKGIHSKLHDVTSDDVYSSAIEFLFTEEYAMERDLDKRLGNPDITISNCLWSMIELKGLNSANAFWDRTLLHKNYYYDIKNNKFNNPTKETLMAICVGLGLSLHAVEKVLSKAGFILREHDDPDRAYRLILGRLPGLSIDDFNNLLARVGIKPLGTSSKE